MQHILDLHPKFALRLATEDRRNHRAKI